MLTARARAKINLFLHSGPRRDDGFHGLASWAAFTEIGDDLAAEAADELTLAMDGPFAGQLPRTADNLVLRAAAALREGRGASLRLKKLLPVASGIGGGSADAAAALHLLNELWSLETPFETLFEIAARLGSDVPVCVYNRSALMSGRGEQLRPGPALPALPIVLVNPNVPVSTADVFARLSLRTGAIMPRLPDAISGPDHLAAVLAPTRNDLEAPAIGLAPAIATALEALGAQDGIFLARMSGSGATCFAIAGPTGGSPRHGSTVEGNAAMPLVLYGHPFSSYTQKALVALYENATPFEFRCIGPDTPAFTADWIGRWPIGKFPLLVDGARQFAETSIIVEYLQLAHPGPVRLLPADPLAALDVRFLDRVFDLHVMDAVQVAVDSRLGRIPVPADSGLTLARERLDRAYAWLETALAGREWAAGDAYTLADCAASPALFYADWVHEIPARCRVLRAYRARLLARPSFARAVNEARPFRPLFPLGAPDRD